MKKGDEWTCPSCGQKIICDDWGVRHSSAGHSINFRKEYPDYKIGQNQQKEGQTSLF